MTKDFNPYEALGLGPDATPEEVQDAYRRASKESHPDVKGGSAERFALVKLARDVLTSDKRRKKYDRHGTIDDADGEPNNVEALAREVIAEILNGIISSEPVDPNTQQPIDILRTDLGAILRDNIRNNLIEHGKQRALAEKRLKRAQKMKKRFKRRRGSGGDFIGKMLDIRAGVEASRAAAQAEKIEIFTRAMDLASEYEFEPEGSMAHYTVGHTLGGGTTFFR